MQFVESLKDYLVTLGHGPFSIGNQPNTPRDVITIYDTGGFPGTINEQVTGAPEEFSIQFKARNASQSAARDALLAIQTDLHRLTGVNIGDWDIHVSVAIDRPAILTREEKEGWTLVSNYEITARESV